MTNIDELFKKPNVPSKRKYEAPTHDPSAFYKSTKRDVNGTASQSNGRASTVEDEPPEGDDDDVTGPAMPPEGDDEENVDDEEGGRFFGGGIGGETKEVLDFMDRQDGEGETPAEVIDASWLRKTSLNFERRISRNSELRAKFEEQPEKFMSSEADLDADIKALSILSEHPDLYEEFSNLGCAASLVSLLAHENTDIAIDAIEIIAELTDEDVQAEESQWLSLVNAMLEADLVSLLVSNLHRFDESLESDRNGVYYTLSILENLSSNPAIASRIASTQNILKYLLSRIQSPEKNPLVSQNKQYAAEILAILLQSTTSHDTITTFLSLPPPDPDTEASSPPLDILLQLLSRYRRTDPQPSTDEEEYVENLFDALTCLVDSTTGKAQFLEAEGIELCIIMLKESKFAKTRAARVLDHALSASNTSTDAADSAADLSASCTSRLVLEAQGLGVIFKAFMKTTSSASTKKPKPEKDKESNSPQFVEHILSIFASLLRYLPFSSAARIRTLAKFVEKEYEKITRLVELRRQLAERLAGVDARIARERKAMTKDESIDEDEREMRESEFLSRRFDAGLFSLQMVDLVLAWCVAEDEGARGKIGELLGGEGKGTEGIKATLREMLEGSEKDRDREREDGKGDEKVEGDAGTSEMLKALLGCI
ncbi:MAG: hypothetical protein Q9160_000516 [Pyrenula sp. 1 TL-2023]